MPATTTTTLENRIAERAEPLDTTVCLVTPERVTFLYPIAGPFRRCAAYLIDFAIWLALIIGMWLAAVLLFVFQINLSGLVLAIAFALQWGYGAAFEAIFNGQTPGKRILGLRVVTDQGTPISGWQAFLRNLTWPVEGFFPIQSLPTLAFIPAITSMFLSKKFQRLGDLAAGTIVIVERSPKRGRIQMINEQAVVRLLPYLPVHIAAGRELSRSIADYVQNRRRFRPAQRAEMTAPLARAARRKFGLPDDTSGDAIVCALYHRIFRGD